MATGKRYYWIKLRESFMTSETMDFLMSQKNGANYVVLYQMLCIKTINTGGRLAATIGEYLIPYDVEKIQRDCKWFSVDTIRIALNLYKGLGLIYEDKDGMLVLAEHENMVGTETDWSEKKRRQRNEQANLPSGDNVPLRVPTNVPSDVPQIVPTDIRDKDIRYKSTDTRVKSKEKDDDGGINPFGTAADAAPPVVDQLVVYATSNLMYLSPYNMKELISFRDSLPDELIQRAIDEACGAGKRTYNYVRGILNRYVEMNFKTVGDIEAHETQRLKDGAGQKSYADEDDFY